MILPLKYSSQLYSVMNRDMMKLFIKAPLFIVIMIQTYTQYLHPHTYTPTPTPHTYTPTPTPPLGARHQYYTVCLHFHTRASCLEESSVLGELFLSG